MLHLRTDRGFTLIELMVVIVIVGILSALALMSFMSASTRSKQSEAKLILKQIYINQRAHRQAYDTYFVPAVPASATAPDAFKPLYIEIGMNAFYTYSIIADAMSFTATATSSNLDEDAALDVWQIDDKGNLVCVSNDAQ